MENKDIVIISGCRTPIGSFGQSLRDVRAYELASLVRRKRWPERRSRAHSSAM